MIGSEFLNGLACHIAWMEGKENGVNGTAAILFCLRNQIAAGQENGDLGRILQAQYYLRTLNGFPIEVPDVRDPSFIQLMSMVEPIFDNTLRDNLTAGAMWWGDLAYLKKERVAQVGTLLLWK